MHRCHHNGVATRHLVQNLPNQVLSPALIADALRTTRAESADTLGLDRDVFSRASRIRARETPVRLGQLLEILKRVGRENGSLLAAYAWFRGQPLQSFGGATPRQLVHQGNAYLVPVYLDRITAGGYA